MLAIFPSLSRANRPVTLQGDVYSGGGSGHIHGSDHHLTTVLQARGRFLWVEVNKKRWILIVLFHI